MSIGFLSSAILLAICAVAALRPLRRPRFLAAPAYLIGMTVNEMPIIWIALGLVTLASGAERHSWSDPASTLAVAITVAAMGGLTWSIVVAVRSRLIPWAALDATLPGGWWEPERDADRPAAASIARGVLTPFITHRTGLARVERHRYGPHRRHRLQVIRGRRAAASAPVLIHFHGGRFRSGDAGRESLPLLRGLARRGWVCISATYRIRDAGAFPASVVDAKRVVAWVRSRSHALPIDGERIVVAGNSAGAHLAMFLALTPGQRWLQPGFEASDTSVAAAIGLYGYYGQRTSAAASSPIAQVTAAAPPVFVLHGTRDSIVPVARAREFVDRLREVSRNPVIYAELPGAQHSFDYFRSVRAEAAAEAIRRFGEWATRAGPGSRGKDGPTPAAVPTHG